MTDQPHPTINTPALKQFAIDKLKSSQLQAYPQGIEKSLNISVVNARVEQIHAEHKYLSLAGNRAFGYGKLLIATGSTPNRLPLNISGRNLDGVMVLHRLKDYQDLRRRLPKVGDAVVVGGGTHAIDTVVALLHWGIRVYWLIRGKTFLSGTLDETASEMVLDKVRRAGAIIYTETEVASVAGEFGAVTGAVTNTDETIPCQLFLCCTGTSPAQALAQSCSSPMMFKNGILVDSHLRTSVPDIYAAGDVAALPNLRTGDYETRGQWFSAVTQGKITGAVMAGHSAFVPELFGAPWLATHLGKLSMLTVGDPIGTHTGERTAIFTDTSGGGYRRLAVVDDRLVGYLSIGAARPDGLSIKRFIDEGLSIQGLLKPLLKGKFDAHRYLTHAKVRNTIGTRPLPAVEALPAFQWPDTIHEQQWLLPERRTDALQLSLLGASRLLSSRNVIPVSSQTNAFPLELYTTPSVRVATPYQPEQSYSYNKGNTLTGRFVPGQFIKPGFIDPRYNEPENLPALVLASGPEQIVRRSTKLLNL